MRQSDVQSIYDACMAAGERPQMSATDMASILDSPFALYCKYHVDPAKQDPPDPFLQALLEKGIEHESKVLESDYPDVERMSFDTPQKGFMEALRRMAGGSDALPNCPLFYLPDGMHGYADILERCDGSSVFGKHHYVVREIKAAINITKHHMVQAAFYAMMLGHIQRRPPEHFHITNGNDETVQYGYGEYEGLLHDCMERAIKIRDGSLVPPAIYGGGAPPWSNYCNSMAIENGDVSLIPGVGSSMRDKMFRAGFHTVQDVAGSSQGTLQRIKGVGGKKSLNYLVGARAINSGRCVRKGGVIDLPDRSTEIFLDLEGLNDVFDSTLTDYLIGILVRKDGVEKYHPFVAEDKREDVMLERFLKFMDCQEDYIMYHWHHYERTHLLRMMERHSVDGLHILEPDVMIDLYPVATGAFAFPTYSNSIKDIAKCLGFGWRSADVGATSSIELYLQYVKDPDAGKKGMDMVIGYNEDDCIATRVVKDWLVSAPNNDIIP